MIVSITFLHFFKALLEVSGCKSEAVRLFCDALEGNSKINYSLRATKQEKRLCRRFPLTFRLS